VVRRSTKIGTLEEAHIHTGRQVNGYTSELPGIFAHIPHYVWFPPFVLIVD